MNWFKPKVLIFWSLIFFVVGLCAYPLVNLLRLGFNEFSLAVFDAETLNVFLTTIKLGIGATLLAVVFGTTLALFFTRTVLHRHSFLKSVFLLPFIIPAIITAIGWQILGNPSVGLLKTVFPQINIYTFTGLVFVEAFFWYTYVMLNVAQILEHMDHSFEESARMCGASPCRMIFDITLPLLMPTIKASAMIVFFCVISSFGVPAIIGSPGGVYVVTTKIYQLLINYQSESSFAKAIVMAFPMIFLALVSIYLTEKRVSRQSFVLVSGKSTRFQLIPLNAYHVPLYLLFFLLAVFLVGLPLMTIFLNSFMPYYGNWNLSLKNYADVLAYAPNLWAVTHSLTLAVMASILLALLAFFIAYYKVKTNFRFKNILTTLALLPNSTPGTVFAMALLFTLTGVHSFWLLLLAYVAKELSRTLKVMLPALGTIHKSLEESSLMCGASWFKTIYKIWFPLLKGTFSTAIFLAFTPIFTELTLSSLLTSADFPTVGTRLFQLQEYENPTHASVLSVLIVVFVLGLNQIFKRASKGRLGV